MFKDAQVGVTIDTVDIVADDVIDLIYKLKRPYRKNAVFITNDSTLAVLRKLKDENGNYLWQPSLQEKEPDRILGYAIRTSQLHRSWQPVRRRWPLVTSATTTSATVASVPCRF